MGLLDKLMGKKEEEEGFKPASVDVTGLFDANIKDQPDKRTISEYPELKKAIMEYQSPENVEKREIFTFDEMVKRVPDYYLPYYWAATYHFDKGNFEEARKILEEGISKSAVKSVLCRRLGEFYYSKGKVEEALYWLFTTVMADTSSIDYHSYLYLAYIYEVYGLKSAERWMLRRSRGIAYKLLFQHAEYSQKKKEKIMHTAAMNKSERIGKKLNDFYVYARSHLKEL